MVVQYMWPMSQRAFAGGKGTCPISILSEDVKVRETVLPFRTQKKVSSISEKDSLQEVWNVAVFCMQLRGLLRLKTESTSISKLSSFRIPQTIPKQLTFVKLFGC